MVKAIANIRSKDMTDEAKNIQTVTNLVCII